VLVALAALAVGRAVGLRRVACTAAAAARGSARLAFGRRGSRARADARGARLIRLPSGRLRRTAWGRRSC
jgi:hypothetical protein